MKRATIERQAGFLLSLYTLLLRAADLIRIKLTPMLDAVDSPWTFEDKQNIRKIKDGMDKVRMGVEYFEVFMLEHGRTKSGSTDKVELYDAMSRDANDFVRFNIDLFNARINNLDNQEKMENLVGQYVGAEPTISNIIREAFRLTEYD